MMGRREEESVINREEALRERENSLIQVQKGEK